jgi:choline dehydrogenase
VAYDVAVVGAGSAGCVAAARLSERPGRSVALLEAGPDYPTLAATPADLADARMVTVSHGWGYESEPDADGRTIPLIRARVVGGCSAVNATFAPRGFPSDFDRWAALGNPGWAWADVLPHFCRAESDLDFGAEPYHGADGPIPIRRYAPGELNDYSAAFLAAAEAAGHPAVDDHNRPGALGAGPAPVNARDGVRMSTAITYLAAARGRPNLEVRAGAEADRVVIEGGRAVGVRLVGGEVVEAGTVVLAAGAFGSPAILLRSGIGPPGDLRALGIDVVAPLVGVGRNLIDHAFTSIDLPLAVPVREVPRFQAFVTARSNTCEPDDECDLHLLTTGPFGDPGASESVGALVVSVMRPHSRGLLTLRSPDPADPPRISLNHFDDPRDMTRTLDAFRAARALARTSPLAAIVAADELAPAPGVADDDDRALAAAIRAHDATYMHPVGTCAMGPDPDAGAVVDAAGHVHGVDGLAVADASVMPDIPAANTNLAAVMIAEKLFGQNRAP